MTANRPRPHRNDSSSNSDIAEKPYALIPFPKEKPELRRPAGHDRYHNNRLHGKLELTLTVKTPVHISTGIVALGTDVGDRVALIKTMSLGSQQQLIIPGSSLKGVVRAAYEAITNSTLAVITKKYRKKMPPERLPCSKKQQLCPASLVFGALGWQGLIRFTDATCEQANSVTGFMPSLYRPRPDQRQDYFQDDKAIGRKFYYNARKAVSGGDRGIPVQQAGIEYVFRSNLQFTNLSPAELGTLLIVLGQDDNYPIALKVGGGKPIGMGTMTVAVEALEKPQSLQNRYTHYATPDSNRLTGNTLKSFIDKAIAAAHQNLVEKPQLEALAEICKWPAERNAPEGMY